MIFRSLTLITIAFIFAMNSFANTKIARENGFNTICQIYTEALNSSMTKDQLSKYIFSNIKNRVTSKDALEAHEAVFQLDPPKRYDIFKQSAKYSLKHHWHCASVETLMK